MLLKVLSDHRKTQRENGGEQNICHKNLARQGVPANIGKSSIFSFVTRPFLRIPLLESLVVRPEHALVLSNISYLLLP
jgi:hypothetical protein